MSNPWLCGLVQQFRGRPMTEFPYIGVGGEEFLKSLSESAVKLGFFLRYHFSVKCTMHPRSSKSSKGLPNLSASKGGYLWGILHQSRRFFCYVRRRIQGFPIISHLYIPCSYMFFFFKKCIYVDVIYIKFKACCRCNERIFYMHMNVYVYQHIHIQHIERQFICENTHTHT